MSDRSERDEKPEAAHQRQPIARAFEEHSEKAQVTSPDLKDAIPVSLRVNGKKYDLRIDPRTTLLDCLREHLHLTGSKKGCDHGQCGACTVHINGRRVNSCLCFAAMHRGRRDHDDRRALVSRKTCIRCRRPLLRMDAYQCGYCTSGQIMSAVALLKEPCGPDDAEVKEFMSGNICRCGAYPNIVAAIQSVRQNAKRRKQDENFRLTRADDNAQAIAAAAKATTAQQGAEIRFIAGGTTLIDLMKLNVETPQKRSSTSIDLPLDKIEAICPTAA